MKIKVNEEQKESIKMRAKKVKEKNSRFVEPEDVIRFVEINLQKTIVSNENGVLILENGETVIADDYKLFLNDSEHNSTDYSIMYRNHMAKMIDKKSLATFKYTHDYATGALSVISDELKEANNRLNEAKKSGNGAHILIEQKKVAELVMQHERFECMADDKSLDITELEEVKRRINMREFVTDDMLKDFLSQKGCSKTKIMHGGGFAVDKTGEQINFEADDFKFKMFFNPRKIKPLQKTNANYSYQYMDFMSDSLIRSGSAHASMYLRGALNKMDLEIEGIEACLESQETEADRKYFNFKLESAKAVRQGFEEKFAKYFGNLPTNETIDESVM